MSSLRVEGLRVRLGGAEVVRGVDFELEAGEVRGILGPSGAGKTTLFRALVGELPPAAGRVFFGDREVTSEPLWKRARSGLGYVPQTPSVLLDLTVARNIETFADVSSQRVDVQEQAERIGLERRLDIHARSLSGGERRKLEVLRALIARPRVLVCDEPFAGVDPAASKAIGGLLRQHADDDGAVVLADHRVGEALAVCDQASLLVEGEIELTVAPEDFAAHPSVQQRYLG